MNDSVRDSLARYAGLREHRDSDFAAHVARLRTWQAHRLRRRHADDAAAGGATPLLAFFAESFYRDLDLAELIDDVEASAARLEHLLSDSRMLRDALALAALSHELDEAVAAEIGPDAELGVMRYVRAYRSVGRFDDRHRQCELAAGLADDLTEVAGRRWSYMAFKLAKGPAHMARMGHLYDSLASGFAALRQLPDGAAARDAVSAIVDRERARIDRLFAG